MCCFAQHRRSAFVDNDRVKSTPAQRLDAIDIHLAHIERLQKELRAGIADVAEEVRLAAAQLRTAERRRIRKSVGALKR
jgi:hypothetical protein